MKQRIGALLILCFSCSLVFADDPVEGYWKSFNGKKISGYWKVYTQDDMLFARCLLAVGLPVDQPCKKCTRNYPGHPLMAENIPTLLRAKVPLIFNLTKVSEGVWENGHIIDARNGKMYTCEISYTKANGKKRTNDCLAVRGEIGLGIGMTIYWEKASVEEINAAVIEHAEKFGGDYARKNLAEFLIAE